LDELYAGKKKPDLTLDRIGDLEKKMERLMRKYEANVGHVGNEQDDCVCDDMG